MQVAEMSAVAANFPALSPSMVSVQRIVSVSPFRLVKEMRIGRGFYVFDIPAQDPGSYHILTVADTFQMIPRNLDSLSDSNPTYSMGPGPIMSNELAPSLVSEWNRGFSPVGGSGVRVMPPSMREDTPEFSAFLAEMTADVRALAEWAIRDASDMHGNHKGKDISDGFHRTLARWLMGEDGARAIPWYNAQAIDQLKKCLACGDSINSTAKVCKSCGTDLVDYFIKYGLDDSMDPVVAVMVKKIKIPKATEATRATAGVPLEVKVNIPDKKFPGDMRAAIVHTLSGEQKAVTAAKKGETERDEYLMSLIPDLCLKNQGLRENLIAKGYVVPNAD